MVSPIINIYHQLQTKVEQSRFNYVIQFLKLHPHSPNNIQLNINPKEEQQGLQLYYGNSKKDISVATYQMPAQGLYFLNVPFLEDNLYANSHRFQSIQVYSVAKEKKPPQDLLKSQCFAFDLFETIFFHISRFEEQNCTGNQLDQWDMMQVETQFLYKHQLHQLPVVDHLVKVFYTALGLTVQVPALTRILTHDIDMVKKFDQPLRILRHLTALLLYHQMPRVFLDTIQDWWLTQRKAIKDPYDNFEELLSKSDIFKRKIIYFMAGGDSKYDHPYDLFSSRMQEIFHLAKDYGYEIGIHPSYNAWKDKQRFQQEWEQLCEATGEQIRYTRQHYLHWSWKETPDIIEGLGLVNDSTLGYNHCTGYRSGTSYSYSLYNFQEERSYRFQETPLVVMDSSVVNEGEWKEGKVEKIWKKWLAIHEGQICFNFHNMYMDSYRLRGLDLVKYLNYLKGV